MILYANVVKQSKLERLKEEVRALNGVPKLSIIMVGESPASQVYVRNKIKFAHEVGIETNLIHLSCDVSETEMLEVIEKENKDDSVNGLFVQLPLPKHIDENMVIEAIKAGKDVDGFTYENIGKLFIGDETGLFPCTVEGILEILKYYEIDVAGKNVVVVGRSNIVGKPMSLRLINQGATVITCNSKTKDIKGFIDNCDIFISAIGQPKFFTMNHFKDNPNVKIIDVGMNRDANGKLCGDVAFDEVNEHVAAITPVPGGVGVMTVVKVIENVVKAYTLQNR